MTFGIVITLRVVGELWRPAGGAYNVDGVLSVMVRGLEEELNARMSGNKLYAANKKSPSRPTYGSDGETSDEDASILLQQGTDLGFVFRMTRRLGVWAYSKAHGAISGRK